MQNAKDFHSKFSNFSPKEIFHKEIFSEYSLFKTSETSSGVNHLRFFSFWFMLKSAADKWNIPIR